MSSLREIWHEGVEGFSDHGANAREFAMGSGMLSMATALEVETLRLIGDSTVVESIAMSGGIATSLVMLAISARETVLSRK